jgi:hypothetical protein
MSAAPARAWLPLGAFGRCTPMHFACWHSPGAPFPWQGLSIPVLMGRRFASRSRRPFFGSTDTARQKAARESAIGSGEESRDRVKKFL